MTTCPYCNTPLLAELSGHVICPRCGETVRTSAADRAVSPNPPSVEQLMTAGPQTSNRQIGLIVLGLMLFMAATGLIFALKTVEIRRARDVTAEQKRTASTVAAAGLSEQVELGYIPDNVRVLLGLDLADLRRTSAGSALLRRLETSEVMRGVDIDRCVAGTDLAGLPPRVIVAAVSEKAIDRGWLEGKGSVRRGGRTLERITVPGGRFDAHVTYPDDRTLIAAQLPADFDAVPATPRRGVERFTHLGALLTHRLDPKADAWLVMQLEPDNAALPALVDLVRLPPAERNVWRNIRGVVLTCRATERELLFTLDEQGRDAESTAAIADSLERSLGSVGVVIERTTHGDWQRLRATLDARAVEQWLVR
jgi:hypothetical protein